MSLGKKNVRFIVTDNPPTSFDSCGGIGMTDIKVTFVGLIHRLVGCREEILALPQGTSLGELFQELIARFGPSLQEFLLEDGDLAPFATVLIDGRNALRLGGLGSKVCDGSQSHVEIVVLGPPLMGG